MSRRFIFGLSVLFTKATRQIWQKKDDSVCKVSSPFFLRIQTSVKEYFSIISGISETNWFRRKFPLSGLPHQTTNSTFVWQWTILEMHIWWSKKQRVFEWSKYWNSPACSIANNNWPVSLVCTGVMFCLQCDMAPKANWTKKKAVNSQ